MLPFPLHQVIASGPLFQEGPGDPVKRRVVLLKSSDPNPHAEAFVVGIETCMGAEESHAWFHKRSYTPHYTHAVRLFCDQVLEQATADDESREQAIIEHTSGIGA